MTDPVSGPFSNPSSGTNSGTGRFGAGIEIKPHAYDPAANPELFDGVLARRFVAFVIDVVILAIPLIIAWVFIFVFGIVTLGLGWALYGLMSPIAVVWALFYYGTTLGGPASATIGMRAMEIEMRTWYGAPAYFVLGAVHAVVFWISVSVLTPLILVVGLFNARGRLLHDFLVGTVVINNATRAALLRAHTGR
jgi:uncharacterized RDD family membrane protein YckC